MSVAVDLTGRVALVTGAGGGLGSGCVRMLAEAGAAVGVTDIGSGQLEQIERELTDAGHKVMALPADLTDKRDVDAVIAETAYRLGGLNVLVNCAGIMQTTPFADVAQEEWRRVVDVNLTATFLVMQAAGQYMMATGGGSIVTLASVAARSGRPNAPHYAAAKAGLLSLTKSAAEAFAPTVRVNAVCPGVFLTRMWDGIIADRARLFGDDAGRQYLEQVRVSSLLQRVGEGEELASVVLFLASDLASYVTGQAINVDGGLEMD